MEERSIHLPPDLDVRYLTAGNGAPLILLHGNGESADYFQGQFRDLSGRYQLYAPDTRGHGGTSRGTAPLTFPQFARDLRSFMNALDLPKAHILGFSDGAITAICFALAYPGMMDRLVLNGANLYPAGLQPAVRLTAASGYLTASAISHFPQPAGRGPGAFGSQKKELLGLMTKAPHIRPDDLASIQARTLVIAGSRDMIRRSHTRMIYQKIPRSKLAILRGDHYIARKKASEFDALVDTFLSEPDTAPHPGWKKI